MAGALAGLACGSGPAARPAPLARAGARPAVSSPAAAAAAVPKEQAAQSEPTPAASREATYQMAPAREQAAESGPRPAAAPPARGAAAGAPGCGGRELTVHFYDVAQGLSAMVALPGGEHIVVDAGDDPHRAGCGRACSRAHRHLMAALSSDLGGAPIDLLWITHPHSDHVGGARDILDRFTVEHYVDNGRDLELPEVRAARTAAAARGVPVEVVGPGRGAVPISAPEGVELTAIAPSSWIAGGAKDCEKDRNECSILLRIDYCSSSILFTGDAEREEEALIDPRGPATLLQVGHHGSDTASGASFIAAVRPRYAVISAGREGEGTNRTYCHPRASTVEALTRELGGPGAGTTLRAFDARVSCRRSTDADWIDVPASDRLWATERDGDVVLSTTGDGTFARR